MGVAIGEIIPKHEITFSELKNKKLGFDAYNIIYQFLSTIRGLDGNLLTTESGKVTSHLVGLFYRMSNLLEEGVKPVFVFDGKPLDLKQKELERRKEIKIEAEKEAIIAKEEQKEEEKVKMLKRTVRINEDMIEDAKKVLEAIGIPYLTAKADAEAQLSVMNNKNEIHGVVSQDYDSLLFGANILYRNLTLSGKRKVPGKDYFVPIKPEKIILEEVLKELQIDRKKLIWIGIMIGTDFNEKIPRIGPKTALKLVKKHNNFEDILKEINYEVKFDYKTIEHIFLEPPYNPNYKIEFKDPNYDKLYHLLVDEYEFSSERVENTINKLKKAIEENKKQPTLFKWM